jgi:hypothetical protein
MLNASQIRDLAANAGFSGQDLITAVAIALAETLPSGNERSYNPETNAPGGTPPGKGSYGLWQIYLRDHPEYEGVDLYDPQTNAHAAFDLYSRSGFKPWSSYNSKRYQAFIPTGPGSPVLPAPPLVLDAATGLPVENYGSFQADYASIAPPPSVDGTSFGSVLLWAVLGVAALWLFEEAT